MTRRADQPPTLDDVISDLMRLPVRQRVAAMAAVLDSSSKVFEHNTRYTILVPHSVARGASKGLRGSEATRSAAGRRRASAGVRDADPYGIEDVGQIQNDH